MLWHALAIRAHWSRGRCHCVDMEALATRRHWSQKRYLRAIKNGALKCDLIGCAVARYGPESSSPTRCLMKLRRRRHFLLTLNSQVLLVEAGMFEGLSMVQASRDELAKPHRRGPNDCTVYYSWQMTTATMKGDNPSEIMFGTPFAQHCFYYVSFLRGHARHSKISHQ